MKKGIFITFEGNDGSGKTTVSMEVYKRLQEEGFPVLYTREPGGIEIAEQIRNVILNPKHTSMDPRCEALLYAASRRQHLVEKVIPALEQNQIVLCDRFIDSSIAYQGFARGIGADAILEINAFAIEGCMPLATIYLDVDLDVGLSRVQSRGNLDRMDQESMEFHRAVANGYEQVKQMFPNRICCIDANQDVEQVIQDTLEKVKEIIQPYV